MYSGVVHRAVAMPLSHDPLPRVTAHGPDHTEPMGGRMARGQKAVVPQLPPTADLLRGHPDARRVARRSTGRHRGEAPDDPGAAEAAGKRVDEVLTSRVLGRLPAIPVSIGATVELISHPAARARWAARPPNR